MNIVYLIGNLGNDPEVRYLPDGTPSITFSLATTERWKGQNGEAKTKTTWHRCVRIGKGSEKLAEYLRKGSKIAIVGKIENRSWEKDGEKHNITEIRFRELEFLDKKQNNGQQGEPGPDYGAEPVDPLDDDVPF